jgi:hypothetical protein
MELLRTEDNKRYTVINYQTNEFNNLVYVPQDQIFLFEDKPIIWKEQKMKAEKDYAYQYITVKDINGISRKIYKSRFDKLYKIFGYDLTKDIENDIEANKRAKTELEKIKIRNERMKLNKAPPRQRIEIKLNKETPAQEQPNALDRVTENSLIELKS